MTNDEMRRLFLDNRLTRSAALVGSAIVDLAPDGVCQCPVETLTQVSGRSRRTVYRAIGELVTAGYFRLERYAGERVSCIHLEGAGDAGTA